MAQDGAMPAVLTIPFSMQPAEGTYKIIAQLSEVLTDEVKQLIAEYYQLLQDADKHLEAFKRTEAADDCNQYMDLVNYKMRMLHERIMDIVRLKTNHKKPFFLINPAAVAVILSDAEEKMVHEDTASY